MSLDFVEAEAGDLLEMTPQNFQSSVRLQQIQKQKQERDVF